MDLDLDGREWHDITCRLRGALTRWKALQGRQDYHFGCLITSIEYQKPPLAQHANTSCSVSTSVMLSAVFHQQAVRR